MGFFSFLRKRNSVSKHNSEVNSDSLVWKINTLAKSSLMPIVNEFPKLIHLIDNDATIELWDNLMTVAMTGVAADTYGYLNNRNSLIELKLSLNKQVNNGMLLFDDYFEYSIIQLKRVDAPWSSISAFWVSENLRQLPMTSEDLKIVIGNIESINILSTFMNMSFGSIDAGFSPFFIDMCKSIEKESGINMSLNSNVTEEERYTKLKLITDIYISFAEIVTKQIKEKI